MGWKSSSNVNEDSGVRVVRVEVEFQVGEYDAHVPDHLVHDMVCCCKVYNGTWYFVDQVVFATMDECFNDFSVHIANCVRENSDAVIVYPVYAHLHELIEGYALKIMDHV